MLVTEPIWQCSLLAQGNDGSEWMNILFIVVVAVFWVIGGIVKAAGAGRKDRQREKRGSSERDAPKRETLLQQLARKAEEFQQVVENQGKPQPRRDRQQPQRAKPQKPPAGHVTVRTGRGGEPVLVYEPKPQSPPARQQEQRPRQHREHATTARTRPQMVQQAAKRPTRPQPEIPAAIPISKEPPPHVSMPQRATSPVEAAVPLVDYNDVDALKKAILHYEILGKPLAFRDPFERISPS
jgi:hypothetical protein